MINLRFDRVSKRYRIYREREEVTVSHPLVRKLRGLWGNSTDFWALRDVSFEVRRGESLGIIGHNGAGKSTILKLLYNITAPTRGEITIRGRLSALIEIASGFHPELTGRENIYLNGSLLGMRRREISTKLDSIVDFAGIAPFIDTPVKRYSSGMYLRLGFAVAAHLDPDTLLLDEVLAVGDADFQTKCIERITELKKAGKTIVFISHDLSAVETLCDRVLLIRQGELMKSGPPREVIAEYERLLLTLPAPAPGTLTRETAAPVAEIVASSFFDSKGRETVMFATGDRLLARIEYVAHEPVEDAVIEVYFNGPWGHICTHFSTERGERIDLKPGLGIVEFLCPEMTLPALSYNLEVSIKRRGSAFGAYIDQKHGAIMHIARGLPTHGFHHTPHTWRHEEFTEERNEPPVNADLQLVD